MKKPPLLHRLASFTQLRPHDEYGYVGVIENVLGYAAGEEVPQAFVAVCVEHNQVGV